MKRLPWGFFSSAAALLAGCEQPVVERLAIPPIDAAAPTHTETATFALGWFWHPDSQFGSIPGVVRTRVGYAGGQQRNPTYHDLGDHTESLQIDFDPTQIGYAALLDLFWKTHNPCARPGSRQYMSAVFYHSEEQKKVVLATRDREAARRGSPVTTQVLPATEFWLAEDYHQKYMLRRRSNLMREFQAMYPEVKDFVASTAAARVNGYLGGNGSAASLEKELPMLGLTPGSSETLRQAFGRGR